MKFLVILITFLLSPVSIAENICPEPKDNSWDRLPEAAFHPAAAVQALSNLKRYFTGEIIVAPEFIEQNMNTIQGAFIYKNLQDFKNDPEFYKKSKQDFCKFIEKNAYLVH
jgi:hypothetical protein